MTCAWCHGPIRQRYPNRRGAVFCSQHHRDLGNRAARVPQPARPPSFPQATNGPAVSLGVDELVALQAYLREPL